MPRHLTIIALGSRGDVQPFVALGLALQAAGYQVNIAAAADYAALVQEHGLEFCPLVGQISELIDPALVEQFLDRAGNPIRAGLNFMRQVRPIIDRLLRDCWAACQGADGLIVATLGRYCGLHLAEKLGIPCIVAHLHPYTPTSSAPPMFFPHWPRGLPGSARYNRLAHTLAEHGQWQLLRGPFNRPRQGVLGLAPHSALALWRRVRSDAPPTLYGYSALVAPPPDDARVRAQITGYWPLAHAPGWRPPAELSAFLERGPPPIYIGFGSMMFGRDSDRITKSIIKTLEQIGQRGILYRGWGELARVVLPPTMIAVDSVPHDWLFPQVRAVVHHGGAGVTSAALRAGAPAVVVPFLGDQHFWAERIAALGAGPAPIPRAQLTSARLEQALSQALHVGSMRERAAHIGQCLRAERGVERAVELIEIYLNG